MPHENPENFLHFLSSSMTESENQKRVCHVIRKIATKLNGLSSNELI